MFKAVHRGKDVVFDDIWMDHYPLERKTGVQSRFDPDVWIHDMSVQWIDRSLKRNMPIWLTLSKQLERRGPRAILARNEKTRLKFRWERVR